MDEEIIHINTSHLVCVYAVLREKRHPFYFFQNEGIFVQLDELDKFTHAWIRIHLQYHTSTEDTLV